MGLESTPGKMEGHTRANIKMIRNMDMGHTSGQTAGHTQVIGRKVSSTAMASLQSRLGTEFTSAMVSG